MHNDKAKEFFKLREFAVKFLVPKDFEGKWEYEDCVSELVRHLKRLIRDGKIKAIRKSNVYQISKEEVKNAKKRLIEVIEQLEHEKEEHEEYERQRQEREKYEHERNE